MNEQVMKLENVFDLNNGARLHLYDQPNTFFLEIYFGPLPHGLDLKSTIGELRGHLVSIGINSEVALLTKDDQSKFPTYCLAFEKHIPAHMTRKMEEILSKNMRHQGFIPSGYTIQCGSDSVFKEFRGKNPNPGPIPPGLG